MSRADATQPFGWNSIEELSKRYLGALPSPAVLDVLKKTENRRPEVRNFVERMFRLGEIARLRATDITAFEAMGLDMLHSILPGAWGDLVPPVTAPNRHTRINDYLRSNPWITNQRGTVLLEMGCGFPPVTAVDAAGAFPDWQILAADPCFDEYLVYDERGNYACMNGLGEVRFFTSAPSNMAEFLSLLQDREKTLNRFHELFESLKRASPEPNGARLIHQPLRTYERANLTFLQGGIGTETPQADIIRCFNVLMYFDAEFRKRAEDWALRTLRPGGIFVCGFNTPGGTHPRYTVYRREPEGLVEKEFAFGIEIARTFGVAWFAMHDGDRETWQTAKLVGILRSDETFRREHDDYLDQFLEQERLLRRQPDGYLGLAPDPRSLPEAMGAYQRLLTSLERKFAPRAVDVLRRAGYEAWVNQIGCVAVKPQN
jgi:SAM-dependent methyltransferase